MTREISIKTHFYEVRQLINFIRVHTGGNVTMQEASEPGARTPPPGIS